jgi:hypothetical protein
MSAGRWMASWALLAAPVCFAAGFASAWIFRTAVERSRYELLNLAYAVGGAASLGVGVLQARLLARHRARVRVWALACAVSVLAAQILSNLVSARASRLLMNDIRLLQWVHMLVWAVTHGLLLGAAQAAAIRMSRHPLPWPLWMAGSVGLQLAAAVAVQAFTGSTGIVAYESRSLMAAVWMLHGVITSAGIALLLDRLVFRAQSAETR